MRCAGGFDWVMGCTYVFWIMDLWMMRLHVCRVWLGCREGCVGVLVLGIDGSMTGCEEDGGFCVSMEPGLILLDDGRGVCLFECRARVKNLVCG